MSEKTREFLRRLCNPFILLMFFFAVQGVALSTLNTESGDVRSICSEITALIMLVMFMIDRIDSRLGKMKERIDKLESYFGDDLNGGNRQ